MPILFLLGVLGQSPRTPDQTNSVPRSGAVPGARDGSRTEGLGSRQPVPSARKDAPRVARSDCQADIGVQCRTGWNQPTFLQLPEMAACSYGPLRSSRTLWSCVRDEFTAATKDLIAKRAGYLCSNPDCRCPTVGAAEGHDGVVNVGVAAHITAASPDGPRYDPALTNEERRDLSTPQQKCIG